MARQQPNHWYDCRCNACVRRRNARRRREADRYSEEGRPLPQGSQLYEIERNLPPVYDSRSMEVQDTVEHVPNRMSRPIPPANSDNYLDRPTGHAPFVLPPSLAREEARRNNRRAWSLIILLIAAMVGVIVYGVVYLDWLEPDLPVVSLPVLLPTPTPTPTRLLPTETPTPTVGHTPRQSLHPLPLLRRPWQSSCQSQQSKRSWSTHLRSVMGNTPGADRQFRVQAANHAIEEGRQTVVDIRRLVDEYCGGMIPTFTAATGTERPTLIKPTATLAPTPTRINFECTVPLPSRPARQPKAPKPKTRAIKPNTSKKPPRTPTPLELQERRENRREYEQNRSQRTERKQYGRDQQKKRRQRAKELGICKTCSQPAIPDQTRCPSCAEKNRQQHRSAKAKRQAANTAAQQNNPGASLPPSSE